MRTWVWGMSCRRGTSNAGSVEIDEIVRVSICAMVEVRSLGVCPMTS